MSILGLHCRINLNEGGWDEMKLKDYMEVYEKKVICSELMWHGHNIEKTAKTLGISRMSLYRRLRRHGFPKRRKQFKRFIEQECRS